MNDLNPQIAAEAAALMQPKPATPHAAVKQFADDVAAGPTTATFDLDAMIAAARESAGLVDNKVTKGQLEAPDPSLVNAILAAAAEQKRIADVATAEGEKAKEFLSDLILNAETQAGLEPGAISELTVNGAVVFTYAQSTSRILNQSHLKSVFPDIAGNEECWTDSTRRPRVIK